MVKGMMRRIKMAWKQLKFLKTGVWLVWCITLTDIIRGSIIVLNFHQYHQSRTLTRPDYHNEV